MTHELDVGKIERKSFLLSVYCRIDFPFCVKFAIKLFVILHSSLFLLFLCMDDVEKDLNFIKRFSLSLKMFMTSALYSRHRTPPFNPQLGASRNWRKESTFCMYWRGRKKIKGKQLLCAEEIIFCGIIIVAWIDWCLLHYGKFHFVSFYDGKSFFRTAFHRIYFAKKKGNKCLQFLRLYGFEARFHTNHLQQHFLLTHQAAFSCCHQTEWFGRELCFFYCECDFMKHCFKGEK